MISFGTEAASEVLAGTLGISAGTQVYVFERLRYADAEHGTLVLSQRQQWSVDAVRSCEPGMRYRIGLGAGGLTWAKTA